MPLISVIIPVYNASSTIKRCIDSIISHHAEIEIICVDDGSKDNSLEILMDLAQKDKRLKVYHQENAGAGAARNLGLKYSCGAFIMFCDADDTYLESTIDFIVEDIKKYDADYIVFHRKTIQTNGRICYWGKGSEVCDLQCSWVNYLNYFMEQRGHCMAVINKVFKKEIISSNDVQFGKFLFGEDLWFILVYLMNSKTFIEDYRAIYQQYQTDGSICMKGYANYYDLNLECIKAFETLYPVESKKIEKFIVNYKFELLKWSCSRILQGIDFNSFKGKKLQLGRLFKREDIKSIVKTVLHDSNYSVLDKKKCQNILHNSIITYSLKYYYYPVFKGLVSRLIHR